MRRILSIAVVLIVAGSLYVILSLRAPSCQRRFDAQNVRLVSYEEAVVTYGPADVQFEDLASAAYYLSPRVATLPSRNYDIYVWKRSCLGQDLAALAVVVDRATRESVYSEAAVGR